jgi:hypothetical protein
MMIFAAACKSNLFLNFPTWYCYLKQSGGQPEITSLGDVWLIVAAVIEILLRVAAIVAVVFIIYAGFSYTTSQGDPEGTAKAKSTLINALVGLGIAVTAAAIVSFIAGNIQ